MIHHSPMGTGEVINSDVTKNENGGEWGLECGGYLPGKAGICPGRCQGMKRNAKQPKFFNQSMIVPDRVFNRDHAHGENFPIRV